MTARRSTSLAAALLGIALLASACGDDGGATASSDASSASDASASPTTTSSGSPSSAAAGAGTFTFRALDAGGPITKQALKDGDVDVAVLFTSDADIATNNWVLLDDDKKLQQIENLVPAIRSEKATDSVAAILNAVSEKLTTDELTELNRKVSQDLAEPADVATEWLATNKLVPSSGGKVSDSITVGSTNFFEQEIVAELYSQSLEAAGAKVTRKFQLGAREVVAPALEAGQIDLYPEYIGTYTVFLGGKTVKPDSSAAADELRSLLSPKKLTVLEPAPAEDRNGFVVTKETADKYELSKTSDLASVPDDLVLGGPPECPTRDFCQIGLEKVYGVRFG